MAATADRRGVSMADVSRKRLTLRTAVARGLVCLKPATLRRVRDGHIPKGNVLDAARLAGIMAAKRTPDIVPLCHPIRLTHVAVDLAYVDCGLEITATAAARERTGVEMEALFAVSAAALTVYDMCKPIDPAAVITDIRLLEKRGGRSGSYIRKER
jgi:cyclic pyranopterin phosphate synthase